MPFDWDSGNVDHIRGHRVEPVEAEQAIYDPRRIRNPLPRVHGEFRVEYIGRAATGRVIRVIATRRGATIRVVTAYPATGRQRRAYEQQ